MKIVYMGTPDFAVAPLEALLEAGYEVSAVVTQPDKQKGRGKNAPCAMALRYFSRLRSGKPPLSAGWLNLRQICLSWLLSDRSCRRKS